jgi:hypothetical protein
MRLSLNENSGDKESPELFEEIEVEEIINEEEINELKNEL